MDMNRQKMLAEVMAADFTLIDLNLYLDTHPGDQRAINIYNSGVQRAKALRDAYEKCYGPISPSFYSRCPWQWIEAPWPWEK